MIKNSQIYEIAVEIERETGRISWAKVAERVEQRYNESKTANAVRKAYKRHLQAVGGTVKGIEERKRMNLVRAVVESSAREYTEKSVIAQAISDKWGKEPYTPKQVIHCLPSEKVERQAYGTADAHYGYHINEGKLVYSVEEQNAECGSLLTMSVMTFW